MSQEAEVRWEYGIEGLSGDQRSDVQALTALGAHGWELVAVVMQPAPLAPTASVKRVRVQEPVSC